MQEAVRQLEALICEAGSQLSKITEHESEERQAPGKWSKKEILGHLIDSASNNHQRFVRAQEAGALSFPGYTQDFWVGVQVYQKESWKNLVELWKSYNSHLAHVASNIPEDRWNNPCMLAGTPPVTLKWLVEDYVRHANHHLRQILGKQDDH
jgi:hypothetical protein